MPVVMKLTPCVDAAELVSQLFGGMKPQFKSDKIALHQEIPKNDWLYLKNFDVEAYDGRGHVTLTDDINKAQKFANAGEAMEAWRTQSKTTPLRPDGKPNRPLTAYSATFEETK